MAWLIYTPDPEKYCAWYQAFLRVHGPTVPKGMFHYGQWLREMRVKFMILKGMNPRDAKFRGSVSEDFVIDWYLVSDGPLQHEFNLWLDAESRKPDCFKNAEVFDTVRDTLKAAETDPIYQTA